MFTKKEIEEAVLSKSARPCNVKKYNKERAIDILTRYNGGTTIKELAMCWKISENRVRQIINQTKRFTQCYWYRKGVKK